MSKETVKILSVEDSEDIAFGIKEYLSKRNFELTLAGSIAQAKKKVKRRFRLDNFGYQFTGWRRKKFS